MSEALVYGAWMLAEALSFAPSFAAARRSGARILQMLQRVPKVQSHETAIEDNTWVRDFFVIQFIILVNKQMAF